MWCDLNNIWKESFSLAWESYKNNTIPIGAVIVDDEGDIISRGRNRIFDYNDSNPLAGTYLAHAEMTAMLNLKEKDHPNIKRYTLYSTMEPCPMCFGAMVMVGIRHLRYAARDSFAGATELNQTMKYIKDKGLDIEKENTELEVFQICMQSSFEYGRILQHKRVQELLDSWRTYCDKGVTLGKKLYEEQYFIINENKSIDIIYDEVISMYNSL